MAPFTASDKARIERDGRCPLCGHQALAFDGDFLDPHFDCDECGEHAALQDTGADHDR